MQIPGGGLRRADNLPGRVDARTVAGVPAQSFQILHRFAVPEESSHCAAGSLAGPGNLAGIVDSVRRAEDSTQGSQALNLPIAEDNGDGLTTAVRRAAHHDTGAIHAEGGA